MKKSGTLVVCFVSLMALGFLGHWTGPTEAEAGGRAGWVICDTGARPYKKTAFGGALDTDNKPDNQTMAQAVKECRVELEGHPRGVFFLD